MPPAKTPRNKSKAHRPAKTASMSDVAREANVSIFTVSAVINNKTHVSEARRRRVTVWKCS